MPTLARGLSGLAMAGALFCGNASVALCQEDPGDDEPVYLQLYLDGEVLADDLTAVRSADATLLPLGTLTRLLGLAVHVSPGEGRAGGFLLREDRRFELELTKASARLDGVAQPFDRALVSARPDDVYVDARLLSRWLPVDVQLDRLASRVTVRPREPLPMQERLQRQRRAFSLGGGGGAHAFPWLPDTYRLWDPPVFDPTFSLSSRSDETGRVVPVARAGAMASADLAFLSLSGFAAGTDRQPLTEARLVAGRKDPEPRLLGPLAAREFAVGDISAAGLPLIALDRYGLGMVVSSFPLDRQQRFDGQSFRGDLPPGWEVELYRNGELIGYQTASAVGRYAFERVPMIVGRNEFELSFYGPEGQRHTQLRRLELAEAIAPPGERYYQVASTYGPDGAPRLLAQAELGLTSRLAATAGAASLQTEAGRRSYGQAGLKGLWDQAFVEGNVALADNGGGAADLGLAVPVGSLGVSLRHARYAAFRTELSATPLNASTTLTVDTPATWLGAARVYHAVDLRREEPTDAGARQGVTDRLAVGWRQFSFAHELTIGDPAAAAVAAGPWRGAIRLGAPWRGLALRGELGYGPGTPITATLGADADLMPGYRLAVGADLVPAPGQARIQAGLLKIQGSYTAGMQASYGSVDGAKLSATLSLGLGVDPRDGRWHPDAEPLASRGAASVRVFLDEDDDGQYDVGEPLLEGVEIAAGKDIRGLTDRQGIAYVGGLPGYQVVELTVSLASLEDPLWVPRIPGVRLVSQPGKTARVDFPIALTSEIAGTIARKTTGGLLPFERAELSLLDASGTLVKRVHCAADGFYVISGVLPGHYRLRAVADAAGEAASEREIAVPARGGFLDGIDLAIEVPPSPRAGAEPR